MEIIIILGFCILLLGMGMLLYGAITHKRTASAKHELRNEEAEPHNKHTHEIYFAGGCFWGVQKYFASIPGVISTSVGYANGEGPNPTYEAVCEGSQKYAETVFVIYNPAIVSLSFLLSMYYKIIDPTSVNKQGADIGIQYRTGIYYKEEQDRPLIDASLQELQKEYEQPLTIEVQPLTNFFHAEQHHQDYLDKHPNGYCHIASSKFEEAKQARPDKTT